MAKYQELVVETMNGHDTDIATYVHGNLTRPDPRIEQRVLKKASGIFMWVVLVVAMLNKAFDEGKVEAMEQKLREVPSDLDKLFSNILITENSDKHETILMLQWGWNYNSALRAAAWKRSKELVTFFIKHGADPNHTFHQYTPLQIAIYGGHQETARVLLEHGANANAVDPVWRTPLGLTLDSDSIHAVSEVKDLMKLLLAHGAEINASYGENATTILQEAAGYGFEEIVRLLLEHGADVNATGGDNGTALQAAVLMGHKDVAMLLLKNGADVNARGGKYGTALQAAALVHTVFEAAVSLIGQELRRCFSIMALMLTRKAGNTVARCRRLY
ncbi:hypothetical protein N0V85_008016 [Neurospora sp. IMI 360204]|nr:hypothetical protein N0V85_008016 [Neurospora sp. IMI 360204]